MLRKDSLVNVRNNNEEVKEMRNFVEKVLEILNESGAVSFSGQNKGNDDLCHYTLQFIDSKKKYVMEYVVVDEWDEDSKEWIDEASESVHFFLTEKFFEKSWLFSLDDIYHNDFEEPEKSSGFSLEEVKRMLDLELFSGSDCIIETDPEIVEFARKSLGLLTYQEKQFQTFREEVSVDLEKLKSFPDHADEFEKGDDKVLISFNKEMGKYIVIFPDRNWEAMTRKEVERYIFKEFAPIDEFEGVSRSVGDKKFMLLDLFGVSWGLINKWF